MVKGDAIGDVMFYGKGAGSLPTASAVVSDVIDTVKHKNTHILLGWTDSEDGYLLDSDNQKFSFYIRLGGKSASFNEQGFKIVTLDKSKYKNELDVYKRQSLQHAIDACVKRNTEMKK